MKKLVRIIIAILSLFLFSFYIYLEGIVSFLAIVFGIILAFLIAYFMYWVITD